MPSGRTESSADKSAVPAWGMAIAAVSAASRSTNEIFRLEQLIDRRMAIVDDGNRPIRGADDRRLDVDAQSLVDRRRDIRRRNGPVARVAADLVGGPDHLAPLDAAAAHENRPAVGPVIAAA